MTETKDFWGCENTSVTAYLNDEGKLTGLSFWTDGVKWDEVSLNEPYDEETIKRIADLYGEEDCCDREQFHDACAAGMAHTVKKVLELLDGTFDYDKFYAKVKRKGHKILLSKLKESTQAMLDSLDQYEAIDWARYIRLNS